MNYILDDKKVYIYPALLKKIGSGKEGKVYKYKNKALKIYHNNVYKDSMNEETAYVLRELNTKRILLPKNILFNIDYEIKGYTTEYISNKKYVYEIIKKQLILEIEEIEHEINYLSNKNIVLNDWSLSNFEYDGIFRFVDPGLYECNKNTDIKKVREFNYVVLKEFLFEELIKNRLRTEMKDYMKLISSMYNRCYYEDNASNFFKSEMYDDESLNQYIKRIAKS